MTMRNGRFLLAVASMAGLSIAAACDTTRPGVDYERLATLRALGLAYLEEGRPADAAEQFTELSRLADGEALGPANLALAELRRGAFAAALSAAEEARRRAPDDPEVLFVSATVLAEMGDEAEALDLWRSGLAGDSLHGPSLWALAARDSSAATILLERLLRDRPGNLPARLAVAEAYVAAGELDSAIGHIEYLRQLLPAGESEEKRELEEMLRSARARDRQASRTRLLTLHNLVRVDPLYGSGLRRLGTGQAESGTPLRAFRRVQAPAGAAEGVWRRVRYVVADTIEGTVASLLTDTDGDGDADLVAQDAAGRLVCLANQDGRFGAPEGCVSGDRDVTGRPLHAADFDGDARTDLVIAGPSQLTILYSGDSLFEGQTILETGGDRALDPTTALDADHDGDLDLLLGGSGASRLYRQDGPGRFSEVASVVGMGGLRDVSSWSFGDLDEDGDLDVVAASDGRIRIASNRRLGRYEVAPPLEGLERVEAVRVADVDSDGDFDLVTGGPPGLRVAYNDGRANFTVAERAVGPPGGAIVELEMDNDGRRDVLLIPTDPGGDGSPQVLRLTADGSFQPVPGVLPEELRGSDAGAADLDGDGDEDVRIQGAAGTIILSNDGGNANHHLAVQLLALADGSGKVNRLGVGSRLDVSASDLRPARVVTGETEHFGLGGRTTADVVRIEWTNGVPQNVFRPDVDSRLVETQVLKGSCGFLYVWTGESFEFVTDMMWKSALGMPLGIMAGETFYAPPSPSLEYVRIPPGMMRERDGAYHIKITEELWEVGYLDELAVVAVDHVEGTEVYVDEAFAAPDVPNRELHTVSSRLAPEEARAGGRDVSDLLARRDFRFVGGFEPGPYQGTTRPHELVLRLAGAAGTPARLFLSGWLFPTDASINVALGQAASSAVIPPYLEVPDGRGSWRRLEADIAFPTGKNKTVVVELPDGLPVSDPRVRISTSMEIYWDEAFYDTTPHTSDIALLGLRLEPVSAELRERGFSRVYRRGGRYGPHWFDYSELQPESPWRPLPGTYTRLGDVLPLLLAADDEYVVFGAGDEISVQFEALPPPEAGRARTFFLYSDAFLKDADLNTKGGQTVEPLPFHGQPDYPMSEPQNSGRGDFVTRYQTRVVR